MEISSCWNCPFLNCSDFGENCKILANDIQRDRWSNIDFDSLGMDGISMDCPLLSQSKLDKSAKLNVIDYCE